MTQGTTMPIRPIPESREAELALIGSLMLRPGGLLDISGKIKPDNFYTERHKLIYVAMLELAKKQQPIDLVSLTTKMHELGTLKEIGGPVFLSEIMGNVPNSTNVEYYANIVFDKAVHRKLIEVGDDIANLGFDESRDADALVESASMKVLGISTGKDQDDPGIENSVKEFETLQEEFRNKQFDDKNKYIGIASGFYKIDGVIDGLRKGHVWVVGGYTSAGKTFFSLNIINNILENTETSLFSLEMSKADVIARLLGIESGLKSKAIQRNEFSDEIEIERYNQAKTRLLNGKLKIHASMNMTLEELILTMTRDVIRNKTKVFVVDYIQQITAGDKEEYATVTKVVTMLQAFAQKTGTTIISLSQISNEGARDMSKEHMTYKGSGAIGATADLAIMLMYDTKVMKKEQRVQRLLRKEPLEVEVVIMKNRHGEMGDFTCGFTPWNGQFETIDKDTDLWRARKGITTFTESDMEE